MCTADQTKPAATASPTTPGRVAKTFPGKSIHTEISPLRCAPVEMTKGRAVLPGTVVAEQEPLFITLGGTAGPSTALRSGRKTFPRKVRYRRSLHFATLRSR